MISEFNPKITQLLAFELDITQWEFNCPMSLIWLPPFTLNAPIPLHAYVWWTRKKEETERSGCSERYYSCGLWEWEEMNSYLSKDYNVFGILWAQKVSNVYLRKYKCLTSTLRNRTDLWKLTVVKLNYGQAVVKGNYRQTELLSKGSIVQEPTVKLL